MDGTLIYSYSVEEAMDDGILNQIGVKDGVKLIVTTNLMVRLGFEKNNQIDMEGITKLFNEMFSKFSIPDDEDYEDYKMRVGNFQKIVNGHSQDNKIWMIYDSVAYTLMLPEDY